MTNLLESRSIKENALKKTKKDLTLSYPQWSTIIHNHQVVQKTHTYIYKQIQHKKKKKQDDWKTKNNNKTHTKKN